MYVCICSRHPLHATPRPPASLPPRAQAPAPASPHLPRLDVRPSTAVATCRSAPGGGGLTGEGRGGGGGGGGVVGFRGAGAALNTQTRRGGSSTPASAPDGGAGAWPAAASGWGGLGAKVPRCACVCGGGEGGRGCLRPGYEGVQSLFRTVGEVAGTPNRPSFAIHIPSSPPPPRQVERRRTSDSMKPASAAYARGHGCRGWTSAPLARWLVQDKYGQRQALIEKVTCTSALFCAENY